MKMHLMQRFVMQRAVLRSRNSRLGYRDAIAIGSHFYSIPHEFQTNFHIV